MNARKDLLDGWAQVGVRVAGVARACPFCLHETAPVCSPLGYTEQDDLFWNATCVACGAAVGMVCRMGDVIWVGEPTVNGEPQ